MSAAAMKAGVALVKPLLVSGEVTTKGTVVIGTGQLAMNMILEKV